MKKNRWAGLLLLIFSLAILFLAVFFFFSKERSVVKKEEKKPLTAPLYPSILPEKSFGDLKKIFTQNSYLSGKGMSNSDLSVSGLGSEQVAIKRESMIFPAPMSIDEYDLVYIGGDFDLPQDKVEVLKRKKGEEVEDTPFWKNIFANFSQLSQIDFSSFDNLKVSSLSFYENKDYGLNFSLDLENSSAYIGAQWNLWKDPFQVCAGDQNCLEKNKLTEKDWDENVFLQLADDFLVKIGLNRSNYENGRLDNFNNWGSRDYLPSEAYIPETVSVFYQQKIDGKNVFDFAGNPDGLRVEIDVRQKKVRGVWSIDNLTFFSSSYPAEQNRDRIVEIAENGGWKRENLSVGMMENKIESEESKNNNYRQPQYPFEEKKKKKQIHLGKPIFGWVKILNYLEETGKNEELYVPSFIFPVLDQKENFWPKNIIVPAVEEND